MIKYSPDSLLNLLQVLYPEWLDKIKPTDVDLSPFSIDLIKSYLDMDWEALPEEPLIYNDFLRIMALLPNREIPCQPDNPVAVILAGGRGTRMGENVKQKSLCPILGKPALLRSIEMYREFGVEHFIIIVGAGYKDVVSCLGADTPNITYLLQEEQLGTGHAARLAARYLCHAGYRGSVLVTMGDKYITHHGLRELIPKNPVNPDEQPDLSLVTASKQAWPDSGRVVMDNKDRVRAVIERPDLVQRQLIADFYQWPENPVPCKTFRDHAIDMWDRPKKLRKILGDSFWDGLDQQENILKEKACFPIDKDQLEFEISDSIRLTASTIEEQCHQVNISVYIFGAQAFYESTGRLTSNNAQGEIYLTDAVLDLTSHHHSDDYHVKAVLMPGDYDVMGFNTMDELAQIEHQLSISVHIT
jgi:UTP-glucose-1-phosphate uridylyltransferase